jgi:hypothetical protein
MKAEGNREMMMIPFNCSYRNKNERERYQELDRECVKERREIGDPYHLI